MSRLPLIALLAASAAFAQIEGAAAWPGGVITWGSDLQFWPASGAAPRMLRAGAGYGRGGCAASGGLFVSKGGAMLFLHAADWREEVVESDTGFTDCLPAVVAGRRGVLMTHLHAQLRFYERPGWQYQELYSIYTASKQGGLAVADVDNDGLWDLFLGNYWVKNSGRRGLPWRIFAVNLFHKQPEEAYARIAVLPSGGIVWAGPGRAVIMRKPANVKDLWTAEPLPGRYADVRAVLASSHEVLLGHAAGVTRFNLSGAGWPAETLDPAGPVVALVRAGRRLGVVRPDGVRYLDPPRK